MKEIYAILDALESAREARESAVLATVVHVKGSAYRRPGARMLILPGGERVGSISGGCLETEVCKKAWWFTERGQPALRVYDTSADEDAVWEFGLGCNGVISVLLERADQPEVAGMLQLLRACRERRGEAVVACVVRCEPGSRLAVGDRLLVDADGVCGGALAGSHLRDSLLAQVDAAFRDRKSRLVHLATCDVFVEWIGPPLPVLILGAGHDAAPLVTIAAAMGWEITVADGRPAYARPERFPQAARVAVIPPDASLAGLEITPETAVVMMTHNFPQDARLLLQILPCRPRYLGLLGPRKRAEQLFEELGARVGEGDIHAPVGLDLGAETPETIALSIAAEIQAAVSGRSGGKLRLRPGSIHAAETEVRVHMVAA